MSKYEIGQQVETPIGKGKIFDTNNSGDMYHVELKDGSTKWFWEGYLKPYKTPHEKLIDLGFTFDVDVDWANMDFSHKFSKDEQRITIYLYDKTVTTYEVCKEAIVVLTEYLEWLEEEQ